MKSRTILVIEDNDMNMKLMRAVLRLGNYEVLEAMDAETGIELARKRPPDLILMDLQLPEMDGLEATRLLKQNRNTRHIGVVALTAHAMRGDEERARAAGCSGYIAKPINTRKFVAVIAGFLSGATEKIEER